MSTRRFEAATTPAALDAVRAAFGDDALILSNRRTGNGVEIIASGGETEESTPPRREQRDGAVDASARTTRLSIESLADAVPGLGVRSNDARSIGTDDDAATPAHRADGADDPAAAIDLAAIEAAVRAAVNSSLEALLPSLALQGRTPPTSVSGNAAEHAPSAHESAHSRDDTASTEHENPDEPDEPEPVDLAAEAMRVAVATAASLGDTIEARLRRMEVALWGKEDVPRSHLLDRLLQLGLGAPTAVRLSEQAHGDGTDALMRDALLRLRNSLPILRDAGQGTTGVLGVKLLSGPDRDARLVAMLQFARAAIALEGPRSVALVSADTRRTGAFSMLEECARELGCVAVRVRHADDLDAALCSLSDRACVLVDAGSAWPASTSADHRLLVLPATLQRTACATSIKTARAGGADGCVLCELHAAGRPGESLEALIDHWLPIAFWSDSHELDVVPRRAEAALIVAAAIGAARRLGSSEHDRLLGELMHPGRGGLATGFVTAVQITGEATLGPGRPTSSAPGGKPATFSDSELDY